MNQPVANRDDNASRKQNEVSSEDQTQASGESNAHPDLNDAIKQELYRQEYLRQIRLRSCPGCGDDGII